MSLDVSLQIRKSDDPDDHFREEVYEANITHNLNRMAAVADIYDVLWRPDENGILKAKQLIEPLERGLNKLLQNPEYFKTFDSPNGWGKYENFVPFVENYLLACKEFPEAEVVVWR